jgi:type II secretory pathway component HofQ
MTTDVFIFSNPWCDTSAMRHHLNTWGGYDQITHHGHTAPCNPACRNTKSEVEEKAETQMSVEYLYEKKSDDDEYNEIWKALEREQSAFERILLNENKAFVMGRLFEAKYLTQKLRTEKDQQLNLVNEQLERQEKAEQVNAEEEEDAWAA